MCLSGEENRNNQNESESVDYETEFNQLAEMFPNIKFVVCIPLSRMDEVLSDASEINVLFERNCYCFRMQDGHRDLWGEPEGPERTAYRKFHHEGSHQPGRDQFRHDR